MEEGLKALSPMLRETAPRRTALTIFLVSMFLFADVLLPQSIDFEQKLDDSPRISYAISTQSVLSDTHIMEANPSSNYNVSSSGFIGTSVNGFESRILMDFAMNFTSADSIQSATLNIVCDTSSSSPSAMNIYTASPSSWNSSLVTWYQNDLGSPWGEAGADGANDRSAWEPPFRAVSNGTYAINVTAFAQEAASTNQPHFSVLISGLGSHFECKMSEALPVSDRPELVLVTSAVAAGNGGSVVSNFADDGLPLMTGDLILTADTTPTLSYDSLVGTHVEYQLSLDSEFKDFSDLAWHYSTMQNSFTMSGTSGSFTLPSSEQFDNGSRVYYRVRSLDTTDTLSTWSTTETFLLPAHTVTDNGDGSASIEVTRNQLGDVGTFIEDSYSNELSKNTKNGASTTLQTSVTSNKESLVHLRVNLPLLGLPSNATILDAQVNLTRDSSANNPMLSMHEMASTEWVENELTWNRESNANSWSDGGRVFASTASATGFNGSQTSSNFGFGFTDVLQSWVENGESDASEFMITARGKDEAYSTTGTKTMTFFSTEATLESNQPHVFVNYRWGPSSPLADVILTGPAEDEAVWNQSGHNFTANLTPSITWTPSATNNEMLLQMATDEQFRDLTMSLNTGVDNDFSPSDGILNLTGENTLTAGNMYFWRMAYLDSDGRQGPWSSSNFLVSSLESTWLGGERSEFRMKHGNGTTDGLYPECLDTYIDSGTPNQNYNDESKILISYNTYPIEALGLLNCNLRSNLLPAGYAVESAQLSMVVASTPSNSPRVAVWENTLSNWTDSGATWNSYDGTNSWATAGAKGSERSSLLDSVQLDSTFSNGDRIFWNVTLGVQNAMRQNSSADFMIGILGVGSGSDREVQLYPGFAADVRKPELTFVYVPGSNVVPVDPVPVSPLNGSWSMGTGVDQTPIQRPTLEWSFGNTAGVGGWAVQLDKSETFDSASLLTSTSWNDAGFDAANLSYTPTTDLDDGSTWYWRVRAISPTNQIGNWSNAFTFAVPDLTTWQTCSDGSCASVELHHREAMPDLNLPNFVDTYVLQSGSGSSTTYDTSSQLKVGATSNNVQALSLLRIPLNSLPQPANARITGAELNLYSEFNSAVGEPIAVRPVYQNWNTSANGLTYDGINNWSQPGARDLGVDLGPYVDLQDSVASGWMNWDVSEAVQAALTAGSSTLSLAIYASNDITSYSNGPNVVTFTSTDGASSQHPWLNLTWSNGTGSVPATSGVNAGPANDSLSWDASSHALISDETPLFSWTYPSSVSADAWRVHIFADPSDDMAGRYTFDSRDVPAQFDLTNLTFLPSSPVDYSQTVRWTVQPILLGMIGPQSTSTVFHVPDADSGEVNSTHAWVTLQEGSMVEDQGYPMITMDTTLNGGSIFANNGASQNLIVGRSPSNSLLRTSSLIEMDFSSLPLPAIYEVTNATLTLTGVSGSGEVFVTVSEMITQWDESSSWAFPGNNTTSWVGVGAYHSDDSNIPETQGFWMNESTEFEINVTSMLQHAVERGQQSLNIILQAEESMGTVSGIYYIASSENAAIDERPKLTISYELDTPWNPTSPSNLGPVDGSTLWNLTSPLPAGADGVETNWTSADSNQTQWVLCGAMDARMVEELECFNSTASTFDTDLNITWDAQNLSAFIEGLEQADEWKYWRVRGDQDVRIGHWSHVHKFRIPDVNPYDASTDGLGNYTVTLTRGAIFENTGLLPAVPDAEISSSSTVNLGLSTAMNLGTSASGTGESQILMEFDLSSLPWPAAITPTSMLLNLYRTGVTGTSATTVSAHACSPFVESSVNWNTNVPCQSSEITRSTLTLSPATGWASWDLTSLAQSNIANGNLTMTILLKTVGSPSTSHAFYSSDGSATEYRPQLVIDYVDNVNGILPPAQPTLTSPQDGSVLYNVSGDVLQSDDRPVLVWSPVSGATGYTLTIANETGVVKYNSWESSAITSTTFRFANSLTSGEVFTWWVQGVNQSIPGPSSPRWTFAIGSPNHVDNGDLTYTYTFQTGNEVSQFGHTNIRETHLSEAYPSTNFGGNDVLELGTNFGSNSGLQSHLTFALDNGQVPLAMYSNVHSASAGFYLDSWTATGGASEMTFSVHRILNPLWAQSSSTWNESSSASSGAWGAPGMQAGVDYEATPITSFVDSNMNEDRWIWFDIGVNGMLIDNDNAWIIIGTPNQGTLLANIYSSEHSEADYRPMILLNHTDVTTIDISPTAPTTDADSTVSFSSVVYDHLSMASGAPVVWSASNGSISQSGVFTPYATGQHTVSACFGIICSSETVTVTPGSPVELIVTPETAIISADDSLQISAYVVDQFGNTVSGQTINYSPSNGSMDSSTEGLFMPMASGTQTVDVTWNGVMMTPQTITVSVLVETGIPAYFVLEGCQGAVPAGILCAVTHTLYDQFGNEIIDNSEAGDFTWTTTNGNYSESTDEYFPDHVGDWYLNLTSTSGASGSLMITVDHGQMASLELAASSTSITADEQVWINTTRIDVRGNRLPVLLELDNWVTPQDSQLLPGAPAIWSPTSRGAKIIQATYETITSEITVTVQEGAIVSLILIVDNNVSTWQNFDITSDDILDVKVKAYDQKDNRWIVSANWSLLHPDWTSQTALEQLSGDETSFVPYLASTEHYTITAVYDDGTMTHQVSINVTVSHGDLNSVSIVATGNDGLANTVFDITSDEHIDFTAALADLDTNPIDSSILGWYLTNLDTGDTLVITDELLANGMRWDASAVGNWSISASAVSDSGYNISDAVSVSVVHGKAVLVEAVLDATTQTAGQEITMVVTGTDSDGNTFPQLVEWLENDVAVANITAGENEGTYVYLATTAGAHSLKYTTGSTDATVVVTVEAQRIVDSLQIDISSTTVDQLSNFTVTVKAFDMYLNQIEVPPSANIDATGRAEVLQKGPGVWNVITLDDGQQTVTITAGKVTEERNIEVEGNIGGFFKAGGPLYYVGTGLLVIVSIVLLGLLVSVLRGGDSGYDDDDDEYDYDDEDDSNVPTGPTPGPSGPAPTSGPTGPAPTSGPTGPAPETKEVPPIEQEDTSWQVEHRVDDDGTEWAEDENGTWWYRQEGDADWGEWKE